VRQTLRFLKTQLPNEHGFFYHFVDLDTGERMWNCELSSIDTSLLLCGVLTARQHFNDAEIQELATAIYERVDWPWMLNGGDTFSMGWKPGFGGGFLPSRWNQYCELMMIYLLAIGSPTHPVSSDTWKAWSRPTVKFQGFEYISGHDPLFTHLNSHAWFDFRDKRDAFANYFTNSVTATRAHKQFCLSLRDEFPDYSADLWGLRRPIRLLDIRLGAVLRGWDDWMEASCPALLELGGFSARGLHAGAAEYSRTVSEAWDDMDLWTRSIR